MAVTTARGIRNNNHLNVRYTGDKWLGLDDPPSDGAFCRFVDPVYGYRAAAIIMRKYIARGINTPMKIINTWAPTTENHNNAAYVMEVCKDIGVKPDTVFVRPSAALLYAMAEFECCTKCLPEDAWQACEEAVLLVLGKRAAIEVKV